MSEIRASSAICGRRCSHPWRADIGTFLRRHYGWQTELFFRFFKHVLGCRHLLTTHPVGIQIQAYCAIIACLLIHLWTGGKPTLRTFEMLCLYLQGWASLEEVMAQIEKLRAKTRDPPARS